MIPDWLLPTFLLAPALLWMFLGVGLPWSLALLPRADWRRLITVLAVAVALGPALTTSAMFLIGTFGRFSVANVLGASALVAGVGAALALRNWAASPPAHVGGEGSQDSAGAVNLIDWALALAIVVAVLFRFWNTAYWPYTTYDEFWVYGYNAKIFMLKGAIPPSLGYYPQLVPLAYTYSQLMWGALNDHAARTVVPVFALGSALMAYVLGARLFNRRVGLLTAAIWMLYPQHAAWNQFGDLEVPVTLYFTGTAAFFTLGWRERSRRYLVLSGLLMGAALWTKPTAGALIESAALIGVVSAAWWLARRKGEQLTALFRLEGFRAVTLALLVAVPMGGMWYVRNIVYGHPPLVFPAGYWQLMAQRSGQELGWPLLIAGAATLILLARRQRPATALVGLLLIAAGSLPSAFGWRLPTYGELSQMVIGAVPTTTPTYLSVVEAVVIAFGMALLAWAAIPIWRKMPIPLRHTDLLLGAFILPYFVTWFWSYSYHYRLSFAIVPLMIVLLSALAEILLRTWTRCAKPRIWAASAIILALALPGWLAALSGLESAITGSLPTDHAKMAQGNAALIGLVDYLQDRRDPNRYPLKLDRPMRVAAPGELRLPFFFPTDDIRTADVTRGEDFPTLLDQIADVDYFVDSSVGQRLYIEYGKRYNQILASLTRFPEVMQRLYTIDDHNFRFSAYRVDNAARFKKPTPNGVLDAQIGDFALLSGYDLSTAQTTPGGSAYLTLWWQALRPADLDYSVFVHLWDPTARRLIASWGGEPVSGGWSVWSGVPGEHFSVAYHTRLWQAGETIKDEWKLTIPDVPTGNYELRAGLYDPATNRRLPIRQKGAIIGDSIRLYNFKVLPKQ
jgi:hypothetical protein